jgi:Mrp family chromosome partitioning ATPase
MIARFAETRREQLAHGVGNLNNVGARILGAIFTMMPTRGNESYYYYSYYGEGERRPPSTPATAPRHGTSRSLRRKSNHATTE